MRVEPAVPAVLIRAYKTGPKVSPKVGFKVGLKMGNKANIGTISKMLEA